MDAVGGNDDFADYFAGDDTSEVPRDLSRTFSLIIEDDGGDDAPRPVVPVPKSKVGESAEDLPGLVMEGRFQLERMLGRGGQATVFETTDMNTGARVAM